MINQRRQTAAQRSCHTEIIFLIGFLLCTLLLTGGCGASGAGEQGAGEAPFTLDINIAGERIRQELTYRDNLEELAPVVVYTLLGIDENDVADQKNYFSSGATAEEIIVFQAVDGEALQALRKAVEARIADQKDIYASYAPEEVVYLQNAILEEKGAYLIYCVPADTDAAAKLVNEILKEKT